MKTSLRILVMALTAALLCAAGCAYAADGHLRIIRVAHNQSTNHPTHIGLVAFEEFTKTGLTILLLASAS